MILTHKELFDDYTKSELKTSWIQKTAKKLNVPRSSVIAELLKSGYKLEEIRRSDENNYKAGLNKYNKWVEEGSPEQTFEVPELAPVIATGKKPYKKPVILEEKPEKSADIEEMSKHPVPEELERAVNENLSEKPDAVIVLKEKPAKEKPKSVAVPAPGKDKLSAEDIGKLRFRIAELEAENRKAADKIKEFAEYKDKYTKLLDDYDLVSADFETVQNAMAEEYQKRLEAEKKLRKAERIICDRIYDDMQDMVE